MPLQLLAKKQQKILNMLYTNKHGELTMNLLVTFSLYRIFKVKEAVNPAFPHFTQRADRYSFMPNSSS